MKNTILPTIALRGITVFPHVLIHFDVGRETSIHALEEAMSTGEPVFLVGQENMMVDFPEEDELCKIGTISHVRQLLRLPGDNIRVMVEGVCRGSLKELKQQRPFLLCEVKPFSEDAMPKNTAKLEALLRSTCEMFQQYVELAPNLPYDIAMANIIETSDAGYVADYIASNIAMRNSDKQMVLEEISPVRRLEKVFRLLSREVEILNLDMDIQGMAREKIAEHQRDYYLREQMKAIQTELGEDEEQEIEEYRQKMEELDLPEEVAVKLEKELKRLGHQSRHSSESTVIRNYIDTCLEVPWSISKKQKLNVSQASKQLDKDHYGLEKVKERILEFLAVRKLSPEIKGQILCLVGPPGVGKTSIASSIASVLGRDFARISLGGVSDEAEIRGHRKTYIGAMPGRVIAAVSKAGSNNPVLLLDEVDKMGRDHRGDPSAALLEALDPEQNSSFRDHYLELPFDLSQVLFIVTANTTSSIQRPLLDRMEIIEIPSYTDEEKVQIGKKYLVPKELETHGMSKTQMKISDLALRNVITGYTHESGVRGLQRQLAKLCRKTAMKLVLEEEDSVKITDKNLEDFLGAKRFHGQQYSLKQRVGIVNGLAWTSVGGELLEVEVNIVTGTGKIILTGNLGDVMKESAQTALSLIRSRSTSLSIDENFYQEKDVHIHFPEGGIPKDGPSAGIAITTAIVSALTDMSVRGGIAMTGEVSLRGRVLAIGGLREKSMAALRNGIKTVLIPKENEKDLEEIDQIVRNQLNFYPVETIDQVLDFVIFYRGKPVKDMVMKTKSRGETSPLQQ
ncbi:MAG: endopeptidase La [Eubacteriales bacterium]